MFCPNCGNRLEENALFCGECGTKIDFTPVPPVPAVSVPTAAPSPARIKQEAPKRSKPKSNFGKLLLGNLLVCAGLFYGCYQLLSYYTAPEQVASRYFESLHRNDLRTAYQCFSLKSNSYLSEEHYIQANMTRELPDVTSYSIQSMDASKKNDDGTMQLEISYQTKENSSSETFPITLVKEETKRFFFFDTWKVSPETITVRNYTLYTPAGTTLTLDGRTLTKSEEESYSDEFSMYDCYLMDSIFTGHHDLKVSYPGMLDRYLTVEITDSGDYEVIDSFELELETANRLMTTSKTALQSILENAMAGNLFPSIRDLFSSKSVNVSEEKARYDVFQNSLYLPYVELQGISLTSLTGSYEVKNESGTLIVEVTLDYDYSVNYIDYRYDRVGSASASTTVTFTNEDGQWGLCSTNLVPFNYY